MLFLHSVLVDLDCNQAQFLDKKIIMKCLAIKILHEIFYNSQLKKYNCNSTHSYTRKSESTFLLILYFHGSR